MHLQQLLIVLQSLWSLLAALTRLLSKIAVLAFIWLSLGVFVSPVLLVYRLFKAAASRDLATLRVEVKKDIQFCFPTNFDWILRADPAQQGDEGPSSIELHVRYAVLALPPLDYLDDRVHTCYAAVLLVLH